MRNKQYLRMGLLLLVCSLLFSTSVLAAADSQQPELVVGGADTSIAVYEYGDPEGDEILLIHGYSQSHLSWAEQYDAPEMQGFRMVVIDLRGHGASGRPEGDSYYNNGDVWADDINAVIARANLKNPVLVGWSYGGIVITDYLRKYGDNALGGIVFVGAATQLGTEAAQSQLGPAVQWIQQMQDPRQEVNIPGTQKFLRACVYADWSDEDFVQALAYNMMVSPATRKAMLDRVANGDDALAKITRPVLIVHGENDVVVLPVSGHYIAARVAHASHSSYPKTGHNPFMEYPDRFNQELSDFVKSANETL